MWNFHTVDHDSHCVTLWNCVEFSHCVALWDCVEFSHCGSWFTLGHTVRLYGIFILCHTVRLCGIFTLDHGSHCVILWDCMEFSHRVTMWDCVEFSHCGSCMVHTAGHCGTMWNFHTVSHCGTVWNFHTAVYGLHPCHTVRLCGIRSHCGSSRVTLRQTVEKSGICSLFKEWNLEKSEIRVEFSYCVTFGVNICVEFSLYCWWFTPEWPHVDHSVEFSRLWIPAWFTLRENVVNNTNVHSKCHSNFTLF